MAGMQLTRKKKDRQPEVPTADSIDQGQSLLSRAGSSALSGLHTVGSLLSLPSRVAHGSLNYLTGGGDAGNWNPIDSSGGIEGSRHLVRMGLLPENDSSRWELSDLARGAADLALDPLNFIGVGLLTKPGQIAAKAGKLTPGIINSIRAGERSIVGAKLPFTGLRASLGTGTAAADALETAGNATGAFKAAKAVKESAPVRHFNALFDARYRGKLHPLIQKFAAMNDESRRAAERSIKSDIFAEALKREKSGTVHASDAMRDAVEGLYPSGVEHAEGLIRSGDVPNALIRHGVEESTDPRRSHAAWMQSYNHGIHEADRDLGFATGELNDNVAHFPRYLSEGVELEGSGQHGFDLPANKLHSRAEELKYVGGTTNLNRMIQDSDADRLIRAMSGEGTGQPGLIDPRLNVQLPKEQQIPVVAALLRNKYGHLVNDVMENGKSRLESIAAKMVHHEGLRKQGLFKNDPLHDLATAAFKANNRHHNANLIFDAISEGHGADNGANVGEFLAKNGFIPEVAAEHISRRTGKPVADILESSIPHDLAHELVSLTPGYRTPPAAENVGGFLKQLGTIWKASILAHPASRVRDFMSGIIQNGLMGHLSPAAWNEARNIAHGTGLSRDYSHIPEVARLMRDHHLNSDEATKILLAIEAPRAHGMVADIQPGKIGANVGDILNQIPGRTPSGFREVMGRGWKSLWNGELGEGGVPIAEGSSLNPVNVAGVGGRKVTGFGPAAASNVVSGAGDEFNRHVSILHGLQDGTAPDVIGKATRAAQVDYDPTTFTPTERMLKHAMPFYSFTSRMGQHTLGELLTNPGGPTAQLIKAEDRAHGQDASLPDSVLSGTSIPLGQRADGTKVVASGLGLMHEPTVNTFGSLLGGNTRGFLYDLAGMGHPIPKSLLEHMTNQSFFQRGEPQQNLDPNVGRTLANLGVMAGLRDENAGPVQYPGSTALEMALSASPLSRLASTARTLTDTRKNILEKLANTTTGLRLTDVSPKKQAYTLMRRAEELAKAEGAHSRNEVYFSKSELEKLRESNPALYARQVELQKLLNSLKAKKSSGGLKLSKKSKRAEQMS